MPISQMKLENTNKLPTTLFEHFDYKYNSSALKDSRTEDNIIARYLCYFDVLRLVIRSILSLCS
jgi:hypothetical protein